MLYQRLRANIYYLSKKTLKGPHAHRKLARLNRNVKVAVRNNSQPSKSGNYVEMRKTERNINSSTFNINPL